MNWFVEKGLNSVVNINGVEYRCDRDFKTSKFGDLDGMIEDKDCQDIESLFGYIAFDQEQEQFVIEFDNGEEYRGREVGDILQEMIDNIEFAPYNGHRDSIQVNYMIEDVEDYDLISSVEVQYAFDY